ncbi:MAG: acyltransferase family protein [Bifidobacterium sp.]|uniref:acyltransferase family protein n=1 Tax=Bifidobacterium sp. TaxID=41200 RepID=UPI0039E8BAC2
MRSKKMRNERIEFLRVCAIIGISAFHVLLAWFQQASGLDAIHPQAVASHANLLADSFPSMWLMSVVNLLGAWGNHVFYMISGFFLISSLAAQSRQVGFWRRQCVATLRRCVVIIVTLAFYAGIALLVNAYVMPIPGVGASTWLGMDLEFIWLYLIFVAIAPAIAWAIERIGSFRAEMLVVAMLVVVYLLNGYIAFFDQGNLDGRGLGDWRKQMSAITYLFSFVFAGLIGRRLREAQSSAEDSKLHGLVECMKSPKVLKCLILVACACIVTLTGILAFSRRNDLLYALSFKSTSVLSFVMALLALLICALPDQRGKEGERDESKFMLTINRLAPGILGFYIAQSLMHELWYKASYSIMHSLLAQAGQEGIAAGAASIVMFFAFGIIFAIALAGFVCIFDCFTRQPALRLLKLSK